MSQEKQQNAVPLLTSYTVNEEDYKYEKKIEESSDTEANLLALKNLHVAMKAVGLNPDNYEVKFKDERVFSPMAYYDLTTATIMHKGNKRILFTIPSQWHVPSYFKVLNEIQKLGAL